jgi:hypothetical protein
MTSLDKLEHLFQVIPQLSLKFVGKSRGCIFSHVWPFYERAVSNLDS